MEASALTFASFNERIDSMPEHPSYKTAPNRRARWGIALVAISGTLALMLGKLGPEKPWVLCVMLILLASEILGLILFLTTQLPGLTLTLANQRQEYAETLDFDMPYHEDIIHWLRSFPRQRLEAMSGFASHRIEQFRSKLPLLTGGIEKLGILSIAVALVIQFKDMQWPPHPSWMQIILFGALMVFYWMCMLMVGLRLRLELYGALLKEALAADDGRTAE